MTARSTEILDDFGYTSFCLSFLTHSRLARLELLAEFPAIAISPHSGNSDFEFLEAGDGVAL